MRRQYRYIHRERLQYRREYKTTSKFTDGKVRLTLHDASDERTDIINGASTRKEGRPTLLLRSQRLHAVSCPSERPYQK